MEPVRSLDQLVEKVKSLPKKMIAVAFGYISLLRQGRSGS